MSSLAAFCWPNVYCTDRQMNLSETIWTILQQQSHSWVPFRTKCIEGEEAEILSLLTLKYTVFTLGSNYSTGQNISYIFETWICTSNSASQVYYLFCFELENHVWGLCWSTNVRFQIRPQEMSEGCFWVLADEDQYAKPELLSRVAHTFCTQRTGEPPYILIYLYLI